MLPLMARRILTLAASAFVLGGCVGDPPQGDAFLVTVDDTAEASVRLLPPPAGEVPISDSSPTDSTLVGAAPQSGEYAETTRDPPPPAGPCDPNYDGCVPIDRDVDCAGGRGNGPSYVDGPVHVIGRDIYGLDRDHDGVACEN